MAQADGTKRTGQAKKAPPAGQGSGKKGAAGAPPGTIEIRMYRLGVGDCFLLRLPRAAGTPFTMLIDCGIHTSEKGGPALVTAAAENIREVTKGKLDVVVGTHEHWDHLSGFHHARDVFAQCSAGEIWCAWTEDMSDPDARELVGLRDAGVAALWNAARHARLAAATDGPGEELDGLLGFFGESPGMGPKAKAAAEAMRGLVATNGGRVVYRQPGEQPFDSVSDDWRIFVLGPPRDRAALAHHQPRPGTGEAYPLGAADTAAANLAAAVGEDDDPPFDNRYAMSLEASRTVPFFRDRYWADETGTARRGGWREETAQDWRRLGDGLRGGVETLALQLDKLTNNTSLVLALEIGPRDGRNNPVILFAADAQVGNWLSWAGVEWPDYAGRKVTGPDLLARTIIYKVGHHASHNATLMQNGLELMRRLRLALVPTSAEMAGKVGWGTLPWPSLLTRLEKLTGNRLLRSDTGASPNVSTTPGLKVTVTDTYFDVTLPLAITLAA